MPVHDLLGLCRGLGIGIEVIHPLTPLLNLRQRFRVEGLRVEGLRVEG